MKRPLLNQGGQTLIEALVALAIITIGIVGVFALLNQSLAINRGITDRYVGSALAAEGIEIVKNIIDTNILQNLAWNAGLSAGDYEAAYDSVSVSPDTGRKLLYDPNSRLYSYSGSEATNFTRRIILSYPDCPSAGCDEHIQVKSLVAGAIAGGGGLEMDVEDHFFHWNQ